MKGSELRKEVDAYWRQVERQGERRVLLKQLRLKFGELPEAAAARVRASTAEEVEVWTDRVLTAKSLDEVLGAPSAPPAPPTT